MKKIKFPLLFRDGYPVRNIEELRSHFDIEKLYEYLIDGRLGIWLEERQYEKEAKAIKECLEDEDCLDEKLCKVFEVEHISEFSEKMKMLQKIRTELIIVDQEDSELSYSEDCLSDNYPSDVSAEKEVVGAPALYENSSYRGRKAVDIEDYWDDWYSVGNDVEDNGHTTFSQNCQYEETESIYEDYWDDWYSTG